MHPSHDTHNTVHMSIVMHKMIKHIMSQRGREVLEGLRGEKRDFEHFYEGEQMMESSRTATTLTWRGDKNELA